MSNESKVLIVDDEPAVAQLLMMLLGTRGFKAEAVSSGREALRKASSDTDLIILDILLPDCQGSKLCHHLKKDSHTKHIPIIVLSGSTHSEDKIESLHVGADDYVSKPFEPEELFARIEAVMRRSHPAPEREIISNFGPINEIRTMIEQKNIVPFFQPIYYLNPLRLLGLEVLSRPKTVGALANPESLFKAALRYGMYFELEMLVWRKALEEAKLHHYDHLFLNCNPYLIESNRFKTVRDMFDGLGMPASNIFLEITERSSISEYEMFSDCLLDYRKHGFKIDIDDVGAGYSSLDVIVKTKPEVVKIDRQIVNDVAHDAFKRSIVKLIVAFCRENSIICIAEGIETKGDLEVLIDLGVTAGQGYYLYKPTGQIDLNAMRAIVV